MSENVQNQLVHLYMLGYAEQFDEYTGHHLCMPMRDFFCFLFNKLGISTCGLHSQNTSVSALTSADFVGSCWAIVESSGGAACAPIANCCHEFLGKLEHVSMHVNPRGVDLTLATSILLLQKNSYLVCNLNHLNKFRKFTHFWGF